MWYCTLLEEDGTVLTFEGDKTKCSLKVVLKVHNPQFYWKVRTLNLCWNHFYANQLQHAIVEISSNFSNLNNRLQIMLAFKFKIVLYYTAEFSHHHWWVLYCFDQIMTRADLGLADAYIDGDISFTDENEGLLNLFLVRLIRA